MQQVFDKFFEHAKELATIIVPGSLLVGVSWLTGTCWALGLNAFGFVSVADVVRSALLASPTIVVTVAGLLVLQQAFPVLKHKNSGLENTSVPLQQRVLRFDVAVGMLIFVLGFLFLSAGMFYAILTWWGAIIFGTIATYTRVLGRESSLSTFTHFLVLLIGTCFVIMLMSISFTGADIVRGGEKASESICLKDGCKDGSVIKRFSDATYVRWFNDNHLSIVLNTEITGITSKRQLSDNPIIDTRPYFGRFWTWLKSFFF